jgi:PAS domain S-box-containing protein
VQYRQRHKDGSWRWMEASATNLLADPDVQAVVVNQRDVTERRHAEESLRQSEGLYRGVVENSIQGIAIQQDGILCFVNPALARIFGYADPAELVGKHWECLVLPEDRPTLRERAATGLRGEAVPRPRVWQGVRKDGARLWAESGLTPISWQGRPAILSFVLDVTERIQAEQALRESEEQLRQSQKMEAIGRLAGGIAHDFNNLLTGILGYADILRGDLEHHASRPLVEEIQKAAERAGLLTNQLLAFSRKQVVGPQVLDLNALLADLDPLLRRLIGEDVQLVTLTEPGLCRVKADAGQLQQVIVNLCVNARDAMPQGGDLVLHTGVVNLAAEEACAGSHLTGRGVKLTVSDTGQGMTPEVLAHVFEPFFTTKPVGVGTGLGLAVVYGILKAHGGHIAIESEPGSGTTFRIYLPCVAEVPEPEKAAGARTGPPRGSETVLVVEDEDLVRALILRVLRQHGYTVLSAAGGEDALLLAGRHDGTIPLLVADVVMPGMSGREVAERVTALRPGLKVLYLSGYTDDAVLRHGVREAEVAFLQKPFTPDALARKVREVLDG